MSTFLLYNFFHVRVRTIAADACRMMYGQAPNLRVARFFNVGKNGGSRKKQNGLTPPGRISMRVVSVKS